MAKKATREAYGEALREFAEKYDYVVLDADLAEATKTGIFKKAYPDRFFDTGIAEANMISVAAGIASTGKTVFASSFAMFAAGRAYEQIRNSVGYPHLNVKIGATHAGITVGEDGATHQCLEDIALMRSIPGMVVINPADAVEAKAAVEFAIQYKGPVYLRFCRLASEDIFDAETFKFELGKAQELKEGTDVTIITTGLMATASLEASELLKAEGISARVINMASIKPIDEEIIVKASKETGAIVTVEDHSVIGGLGTAVADVLAEKAPAILRKIGVQDKFGRSGKPAELLKVYGMTAEDIAAAAKDAINNK
ncbi:MAG: transketolase family protein [Clostridia bacterium]|nr:transketolase family protein [Clostridia bacterium]